MFGKKIEQIPVKEERGLTPEQEASVVQEQIQEMKEKLDDPQGAEAIQEETENILSKMRKKGSAIKESTVRWAVAVAAPVALFGSFAWFGGDIKTPQREPGSKAARLADALGMASDGIQNEDEYKLIRDARDSMEGYVLAVGDNVENARERCARLNKSINEYERTHPEEGFEQK